VGRVWVERSEEGRVLVEVGGVRRGAIRRRARVEVEEVRVETGMEMEMVALEEVKPRVPARRAEERRRVIAVEMEMLPLGTTLEQVEEEQQQEEDGTPPEEAEQDGTWEAATT